MNRLNIPLHFFVSYSHDDEEIVQKLVADLEKEGIATWVDKTGIQPGTPSWEEIIRQAMEQSFGVLLIASPSSRKSIYVQGELSLARDLNCEIYPLWVSGDKWTDSVVLGIASTQYIDLKDERYSLGLVQLINALKDVEERKAVKHFHINLDEEELGREFYSGYLRVGLGDPFSREQREFINMRSKSYRPKIVQEFLDELYLNYLSEKFPPYTYGTNWVLGKRIERKIGVYLLFVPRNWLISASRSIASFNGNAEWYKSLLSDHDFDEFNVIENPRTNLNTIGLLANYEAYIYDYEWWIRSHLLFGEMNKLRPATDKEISDNRNTIYTIWLRRKLSDELVHRGTIFTITD